MFRRVRESIIRILSEADTIYVGKGVYRWVNQHDKLVIRSDQRIVPCESVWPDWTREKFMLTTMERDWDEIANWFKPKGIEKSGTYDPTNIEEGWKQWKRWIAKNRNMFIHHLELSMIEADKIPKIEDLENIRETQNLIKKEGAFLE